MLKFAYNSIVDVYRRAGAIDSGSYSYSSTELNEPQYGDVTTNWIKMSTSLPCRIEEIRMKTDYLPSGERLKAAYRMYSDFSDSKILAQDRILRYIPIGSDSLYTVYESTDKYSMAGKILHYEITLTLP